MSQLLDAFRQLVASIHERMLHIHLEEIAPFDPVEGLWGRVSHDCRPKFVHFLVRALLDILGVVEVLKRVRANLRIRVKLQRPLLGPLDILVP